MLQRLRNLSHNKPVVERMVSYDVLKNWLLWFLSRSDMYKIRGVLVFFNICVKNDPISESLNLFGLISTPTNEQILSKFDITLKFLLLSLIL